MTFFDQPAIGATHRLPSMGFSIDEQQVHRPDEESTLWERWIGHHDIAAAHLLARRYRDLVVEVAIAHSPRRGASDALIAEAQIGLMRAICRFSPVGNACFRRYAASFIRAAMGEPSHDGSLR